jgi:RNA polymerase sigma factor for flagellar operon FliA
MDELSALVKEYEPDVRRMAHRLRTVYGCRMAQADLEQLGQIGVVQAQRSYDPSKGPLKPYVLFRAEHEMKTAARTERRQTRVARMWAAVAVGAHRHVDAGHTEPTPTENYAQRRAMLENAVMAYVLAEVGATSESPEDMLAEEDTREHVKSLVEQLPERHRRCVQMHYYQKVPLKEIGVELGIHISRVSHTLKEARDKLHLLLHPSPES